MCCKCENLKFLAKLYTFNLGTPQEKIHAPPRAPNEIRLNCCCCSIYYPIFGSVHP